MMIWDFGMEENCSGGKNYFGGLIVGGGRGDTLMVLLCIKDEVNKADLKRMMCV